MTPRSLYPGVNLERVDWFEAVVAEEHARNHARAIRAYADTIPKPTGRLAWVALREWTARVNGLRAAAHLLDERALAYRLHANDLKEKAK